MNPETIMPLNEILAPDAVIASLRVNGKKQALQELSERAAVGVRPAGARDFRCAAAARAAGLDRGRRRHRHSPRQAAKCGRIFGIFARLERAIDFEALDGLPVDLIFLLMAPESAGRGPSEGAGADRPRCAQPRPRRQAARHARSLRAVFAARADPDLQRGVSRLRQGSNADESPGDRHFERRRPRSAGQGDRGRAEIARRCRNRQRAPGQGVRHRDRRRRRPGGARAARRGLRQAARQPDRRGLSRWSWTD